MDWNNLQILDEKYYRDLYDVNGVSLTWEDVLLYEDDNYAIIREYYKWANPVEEIDNKVSKLFENKKVIGLAPSEFWNDDRAPFVYGNDKFYRQTCGYSNGRWDVYFQVKCHIESLTILHPEVYDIDVKPEYQCSYLGRRGTEKRWNFFVLTYEHKNNFFINYWNYHWKWQNVEKCFFDEWNGIEFPYFTEKQEMGTWKKRINNYHKYNAKLLSDAVKLQTKSKYNLVLETYDSGPIITEKSILPFLAKLNSVHL